MADYQIGYSLDSTELLESLLATDQLLIIQDLDGVCMQLVGDPLTRQIEPRYIAAAARLAGQFYVLTNGEHIGSRGVNPIVERACATPSLAAQEGLYLPGLAAGGVQLQDRFGVVTHPGVSDAELAFLQQVPHKAAAFLRARLSGAPYSLDSATVERLIASTVLDNLASPTVNINAFYRHFAASIGLYRQLQNDLASFLDALHREAIEQGLEGCFFTHFAPNSGRDSQGLERLKPASEDNAGTTDFQFMLTGAIKEVGVLVILNHYYFSKTGEYPLGEDFNARQAPRDLDGLLALANKHFDRALMPRIVGVGDTLSSSTAENGTEQQRGGSDRGFLSVVQALGESFERDNQVVYIDSSAGEVKRPGVDAAYLQRYAQQADLQPWPGLMNITDAHDPLRLDVIFAGGYQQYVEFFCTLAERRTQR
ncbi:MAG: glucosylglycerol 3-phosphatase [Pseudomonadaceae bacterium]|nr:glucosylglycerol 3-phosphatase [Pseudomonadaceae bacterium]